MKKILIFGASGMVGSHLAIYLRKHYRVWGSYSQHRPDIDGITVAQFSIRKGVSFEPLIRTVKPDVIVYCAGVTREEDFLRNPTEALYVNCEMPFQISATLGTSQTRLIYISSSKVFSGQKGDYGEEDKIEPLTRYGESKAIAESLLKERSNVFILRVGSVFALGASRHDSILNRILRQLGAQQELPLIQDEFRSFLGMEDLSHIVGIMADAPSESAGLYHVGSPEKLSYYQFGMKVAEAFKLPISLIKPVRGETFSSGLPDYRKARGKDTSLKSQLLQETFSIQLTPVDILLHRIRTSLNLGTQ